MANLVRVGVKNSFFSCAAVAGFESVQSVLQQMSSYTLSDIISLAACSTAEKGFQNRINLFRPDV